MVSAGGLAANCGLTPDDEGWMLAAYFGRDPGLELWRSYRAMKAAAALRETLWSMVSELHSSLDFDFVGCSVAYHLGKLGWSDTVLLERGSKHVGGGPAAAAAPCGREPGI